MENVHSEMSKLKLVGKGVPLEDVPINRVVCAGEMSSFTIAII